MLSKLGSLVWRNTSFGISEEQVDQEFSQLKLIRQNKIHTDKQKLLDRISSRLEPFPNGAFEKLTRNNIWETVLENLDPVSLGSAHSCCQSFKSLSEESLLVHVLRLLKNKGWLHLKHRDWNDTSYQKHNHDIWNLRLVSKSWKRVAEHVYFNVFPHHSWYANVHYKCPETSPVLADCSSERQLRLASNALKLRKDETQLFQLVMLNMDDARPALHFLNNYGHLIQGVILWNIFHCESTPNRNFLLVHFLKRLPNLKVLLVLCCRGKYIVTTTEEKLHERIPTIPSLTMVRFRCRNESHLILSEVIRANPHVKNLKLPGETPVTPGLSLQMENLSSLTEYMVPSDSFQQARVLRQVNWPLRHLRIDLMFNMPYEELFNLVNKFGSTLKTLSLFLYPFQVPHHIQLKLPNLKKFEVDGLWKANDSLDFLLPCRSLQQLQFSNLSDIVGSRIRNRTFSAKCRNLLFTCKFRHVLLGNTVEESNLWGWFPRLVCVRIAELEQYLYCIRQEHYVRKGSDVVQVCSALDCEIKCKTMNDFISPNPC